MDTRHELNEWCAALTQMLVPNSSHFYPIVVNIVDDIIDIVEAAHGESAQN